MIQDAPYPIRPGAKQSGKKRKARAFPKGRQVQPAAHHDIANLLGDRPRDRDLLIEHLHLIQDKWHHISAAHLAALAHEMKLSQAEVYEVATFYHHFDVVKENQQPPPQTTIRVCNSLSCQMAGAEKLRRELEATAPENIAIVSAPCMGLCDKAPAVGVGKNYMGKATADTALNSGPRITIPQYRNLSDYRIDGGYEIAQNPPAAEKIIDTLLQAGLSGLGGAGFPSGQKWKFVRAEKGPRYMCVNADEGEPGTFKDRHYLSTNPHQFLEGMLIAAGAVEAEKIYIYLRDEYPAIAHILKTEIAEMEKADIIKPGLVQLRRGAGAYICGEESAMIESIEGKRGIPRHRPPFVAQRGLFDRPTLVHNVETLYWIPPILKNGADWFVAQGRAGHKGNRSYSVSGRVKNPGVILTAAGATANQLIELCGGMADGHSLKAYLPGGASGGILPASLADLPLDFGTLAEHGCFVGSHAVIILSDHDNMADVARNLMAFFKHESCGQCTPCRAGCEKALALMAEKNWDTKLLGELSSVMADASICGLGQAAPNPLLSVLKYFGKEV
jgi:formate dehydrogenase